MLVKSGGCWGEEEGGGGGLWGAMMGRLAPLWSPRPDGGTGLSSRPCHFLDKVPACAGGRRVAAPGLPVVAPPCGGTGYSLPCRDGGG